MDGVSNCHEWGRRRITFIVWLLYARHFAGDFTPSVSFIPHNGHVGGSYHLHVTDKEAGPSESSNLGQVTQTVKGRKGYNPRSAVTICLVLFSETETDEDILHYYIPSTILNAFHVLTPLILTMKLGSESLSNFYKDLQLWSGRIGFKPKPSGSKDKALAMTWCCLS